MAKDKRIPHIGEKADRCLPALAVYAEQHEEDHEPTQIIDLISDLCHQLARNGCIPQKTLMMAGLNYNVEAGLMDENDVPVGHCMDVPVGSVLDVQA